MNIIQLEVVAPMLSTTEVGGLGCGIVLSSLGIRSKYQAACTSEYPDDWREAIDFLSGWMKELQNLYRHRITIQVIDAYSPLGLWKQLRYRLFRFPAFIVDGKKTYVGWDHQELETLIDDRVQRHRR